MSEYEKKELSAQSDSIYILPSFLWGEEWKLVISLGYILFPTVFQLGQTWVVQCPQFAPSPQVPPKTPTSAAGCGCLVLLFSFGFGVGLASSVGSRFGVVFFNSDVFISFRKIFDQIK